MYQNSNSTMSAVGIHCETIQEVLTGWGDISIEEVRDNWIELIEKWPESLLLDNVLSSMEIVYAFINETVS